MSKKKRVEAELHKERKTGLWIVKITLPEGKVIMARHGQTQHIVYDDPQRVPTHLKASIVPRLLAEAKQRNLRGE